MKIKKLCTLVLAAVATVTAFSGCGGGGGDKDASNGYISAKKFANGSIRIQTWGAVTGLEIIPDGNKLSGGTGTTITIPGAAGEEKEEYDVDQTVHVSGTIGARGGTPYECDFHYSVVNGGELGHLTFTFTVNGTSASTDKQFINALGIATSEDDAADTGYNISTLDNIASLSVDMLFHFAARVVTINMSTTGVAVGGDEEDDAQPSAVGVSIIEPKRYYSVLPH